MRWMERKGKEREKRWKERAPKEERDAASWEVKLQLISLGRQGRKQLGRAGERKGKRRYRGGGPPTWQGSGAELCRRAKAEKGLEEKVRAQKHAGEEQLKSIPTGAIVWVGSAALGWVFFKAFRIAVVRAAAKCPSLTLHGPLWLLL